jgi:cytochrome c-type biogenesis protein CcmE
MQEKEITFILEMPLLLIIIFFFTSCQDLKLEYTNFKSASEDKKTCQVKGIWVREINYSFNDITKQFSFYMKDDNNTTMRVVLDGYKPNNFEMAEYIVVKGKVEDGYFHAKLVLTKCPSQYEQHAGNIREPEKSGIQINPPLNKTPFDNDIISADDIITDYEENQIRADGKYLNKKLLVKGLIYKISKSPTDYTIIEIRGEKNSYPTIQCSILHKEDKKALQYSKGDEIILKGKCCGLPENIGYYKIIFVYCNIIQ